MPAAVPILFLACVFADNPSPSPSKSVEFALQRRDAVTGRAEITREALDPARVGIVVIDMWNWHWCKTSAARVACLVPRMSKCLEAARGLGMQVFWCPTDVADNYAGTPMVEEAIAVPRIPLPSAEVPSCPPARDGGGCTCGKERCRGNYGWDGMHPDLVVQSGDLMPNEPEALYSLAQAKGITHLIYMGVHTQVCLLGKSVGVLSMLQAGMKCILARDLTDAHGCYDPAAGITPDGFTAEVVEHFEKHLVPTIDMVETLRAAGKWDCGSLVDPVRFAPWGTPARPHLFDGDVTVTLSAPLEAVSEIRFTLDGSEPAAQSAAYRGAIRLETTAWVRARAFSGGSPIGLASEAFFARLGKEPPRPDIHVADLEPWRAVGPGHSPSFRDHRFSATSNPPQTNRSNRKGPLRLRGKTYETGLGVHAPSQVMHELKPEYDRFVARAGIDEGILETSFGSNLAMHPSVVFRVFIDGKLAAESPVMRISEEPWRFDVKIPAGSRRISLCATDAGDGNREDLADWVDAGFVVAR